MMLTRKVMIGTANVTEMIVEAATILMDLYGTEAETKNLYTAAYLVDDLYAGRAGDGYLPTDTSYHDAKHTFDTALATARIIDGHEMTHSGTPAALGPELAELGVVAALFHDTGYIRRISEGHLQGGMLTRTHVGRGVQFFRDWLDGNCLYGDWGTAHLMLHYTGYEFAVPEVDRLVETPQLMLLGRMIGAADLISQMADRFYLERCRDHLFDEFRLAGITDFKSPEDLLANTPKFVHHMLSHRMSKELWSVHKYLEMHFGESPDPYMQSVTKQLHHLEKLLAANQLQFLRRNPRVRARYTN